MTVELAGTSIHYRQVQRLTQQRQHFVVATGWSWSQHRTCPLQNLVTRQVGSFSCEVCITNPRTRSTQISPVVARLAIVARSDFAVHRSLHVDQSPLPALSTIRSALVAPVVVVTIQGIHSHQCAPDAEVPEAAPAVIAPDTERETRGLNRVSFVRVNCQLATDMNTRPDVLYAPKMS